MPLRAFATDYDGTLAHHGTVDPATVDAVTRLREAGWKTLMVTGREIPDLMKVFSEYAIFDLIVAENGALLHWPATQKEKLLSEPPPRAFADFLRRNGVNDLSVGRVVVATTENYILVVEQGIRELKLNLEIILNKGSVMVLPRGVHKGFGLAAAAQELGIPQQEIAAIGDAENDFTFLSAVGFGVAVDNALPSLKQQADWVTPSGHGTGVRELIDKILSGDFENTN